MKRKIKFKIGIQLPPIKGRMYVIRPSDEYDVVQEVKYKGELYYRIKTNDGCMFDVGYSIIPKLGEIINYEDKGE